MKALKDFTSRLFRSAPNSALAKKSEYQHGLDLGRTRVFYAAGRVESGKLRLNKLTLIPFTAGIDLGIALKKLFDEEGCPRDAVCLSLKSPQVITRFLRFPKMTEEELRGVLQFEIEQYVPYEAKDLYMDLSILQESIKTAQGENTEIFVAVAKKDYLDPLIAQFRAVQSEIAVVDVDMLACMKALEFFQPDDFKGHTAVLDLGVHVSTLGVVRSGLPKFIRDLSFGTQDITKKLKTRAGLEDDFIDKFIEGALQVGDDQKTSFADSIESLINDVKVSFDFYRDQSEDGLSPDKLFICGLGSKQKFIADALESSLGIPIMSMDLLSKLEFSEGASKELFLKHEPDLPVLLGLVLREND